MIWLRKSVFDDIISANNNIFNQTKTTEIAKVSPSYGFNRISTVRDVRYGGIAISKGGNNVAVVSRNVRKCPVCGSEAVLLDAIDDGIRKYFVYCLNVERCGLGTVLCCSPEEAIKAWNAQEAYAAKVHAERRDKA